MQQIGRTVQRIAAEKGLTVLLVEQNLELAGAMAQRCLFIENGRIREEVAAEQMRLDPALARKYLSV